jgi:PAS domain S-box-containing protein
VSERQANAAENQLFRAALDLCPLAYIGFRRSGALFFYNQAAERLFGYPQDQVGALDEWLDRISAGRPQRERLSDFWRRVFDGEEVSPTTCRIHRPDGASRAVIFAVCPSRQGGAAEAALVLVEESRRRPHRAAEERRAFEQQRSNLLATISHELRAPLVSIRGYNELVLTERLGPVTPRQRRGLEIALRNIGLLVELIDNLILQSKLELGVGVGKPARLDLGELVRDIFSLFQPQIEERKISLSLSLPAEPLVCLGDRSNLYRAINNLVANAVKFTNAGGAIELRGEREGSQLKIAVKDTGIGIAGDELARIFEPFYQVEGTVTRRYRGAGLGLSLARDIVARHGGRIDVESVPERGSCFTIVLPAAE